MSSATSARAKVVESRSRVALVAGILSAGLGVVSLLGWGIGSDLMTALEPGRIPMAPSTAVLFVLFGLLVGRHREVTKPGLGARAAPLALAVAGTGAAFVLLVLSLAGITPAIEHLGLSFAGEVAGAPIGHMSPLTALGFLLVGASLIQFMLPPSHRKDRVAWLAALVLVLLALLLTVAYLLSRPLLYDTGVIPPALNTAIGLLLLGVGLLAIAARRIWPPSLPAEIRPQGAYRLIATLLLVAAVIIAPTYFYFRHFQTQFRAEVEGQLLAVAELKVDQISDWREERLGDAGAFHGNPVFSDLVVRALDQEDASARSDLVAWFENISSTFGYPRISLYDSTGRERISVPASKQLATEPQRSLLDPSSLTRTSEVTLEGFRRDSPADPIHLTLIVPIVSERQGGTTRVGTVALRVDPRTDLYPMLKEWPSPSRTAETLLVRRDGDDVLFLNDLRFLDDAALDFRLPLASGELPAARAVLGQQGIVEGLDYRGKRVVAALRAVPGSDWYLVARVDVTEVYGPLQSRLQWTLALVAVLLLGAVSGVGIVWERREKLHYRSLALSKERYGTLLRSIGDAVISTGPNGLVELVNPVAEQLTGWSEEEAKGRPLVEVFSIVSEETREPVEDPYSKVIRLNRVVGLAHSTLLIARDGTERPITDSGAPVGGDDGAITGVVLVFRDQTEEREARLALAASESRFRTLFEAAPVGIFRSSVQGRVLSMNQVMADILGFATADDAVAHYSDVARQLYRRPERRDDFLRELHEKGRVTQFVYEAIRSDGETIWLEMNARVATGADGAPEIEGFVSDVTARSRAEQERQGLEQQLAQAQRMESVGRLAGGVAHDFNNMLTVIQGQAELALARPDTTPPLRKSLTAIHDAAEHSAELTRQLLAFAREQIVQPRVIDLNDTVESMLKMLRRLIGEDVELAWRPTTSDWRIRVDPVQIDQTLANLLVNARDAIDGAGTVTIQTETVTVDEPYARRHPGAVPGDFVVLEVSDDGRGMDPETLAKVFDPFFTTKEPGKGTGLGLATVYGVVRQNGGFIHAYSEEGVGTTFRVYLPRFEGEPESVPETVEDPVVGGTETILVVEDQREVLALTEEILQGLGYSVLSADDPRKALELVRKRSVRVDLLLTDVVMPEMTGRELATQLHGEHPEIRVLYMSGYPADVIAHRGVIQEGVHFVQKPFTLSQIAAKVREALDTSPSG